MLRVLHDELKRVFFKSERLSDEPDREIFFCLLCHRSGEHWADKRVREGFIDNQHDRVLGSSTSGVVNDLPNETAVDWCASLKLIHLL